MKMQRNTTADVPAVVFFLPSLDFADVLAYAI